MTEKIENSDLSESMGEPLNKAQDPSQYERWEKRDGKKHRVATKEIFRANTDSILEISKEEGMIEWVVVLASRSTEEHRLCELTPSESTNSSLLSLKQLQRDRADKNNARNVPETARKEEFMAEMSLLLKENAEEEDKPGEIQYRGNQNLEHSSPKNLQKRS